VDPLTHALAGAAAARVVAARPLGRAALLPGAVGALLPDVDALIRSASDPLLYAEFHRHFTHSLAFIPVGGAIAALPWLLRARHRPQWRWWLLATTAGYATHGVLDACTTWGTRLYWPVSDTRVAWNLISIVDPLFTLVLLAGVVATAWGGRARAAAMALVLCAVYLGIGVIQHARAREAQDSLAAARGHQPTRAAVLPGFTTNLVWRSLYEADGVFHTDRVRVPWWGAPTWSPGYQHAAASSESLSAASGGHPRITRDLMRFRRFTGGWVAAGAFGETSFGDARYSGSATAYEPVWSVRLTGADPPVAWVDRSRDRRVDPRALVVEVLGRAPDHRPLPSAEDRSAPGRR